MSDAKGFHWVTEDQEGYLKNSSTSAWQQEWPEFFGKYLDHIWSGWQQEDDDLRRSWLDERAKAVALGWLRDDQRDQLSTVGSERGDWREWVPIQMDEWWPDWAKASPDELSGWFDSALQGLFPEAEAEADPEPLADPRGLEWLTEVQRNQLDTLVAARGDWREWLPLQMDEWWPDWTQADSAQLATWFDGALPSLVPVQQVAPESVAEPVAEAAEPVIEAAAAEEPVDAEQTAEERLQEFQAIADDPAVEGIDREVLDGLLQDPAFETRMAEADALIDEAIADALVDVESS
jgi:hypothetical protein